MAAGLAASKTRVHSQPTLRCVLISLPGELGRSAARLVTARFILQGSRPRRLLLPALLPLRKAAAATAAVPAPACCPSSPASSKRGLPCMLPEKEDAGLLE